MFSKLLNLDLHKLKILQYKVEMLFSNRKDTNSVFLKEFVFAKVFCDNFISLGLESAGHFKNHAIVTITLILI